LPKTWKDRFPTKPNEKLVLTSPDVVRESLEDFLAVENTLLDMEKGGATLAAVEAKKELSVTLTPTVSIIAFTAACRALGLKVRLVGSLHPIPLSFAVTALHPLYREPQETTEGATPATSPSPPKSKENSSSTKSTANKKKRISSSSATSSSTSIIYDEYSAVELWAEVFSEFDNDWIPLNPVTGATVAERMEPPAGVPDQCQLTYVIAFEDGKNERFDSTSHYIFKESMY
jgi:hypothetical protein